MSSSEFQCVNDQKTLDAAAKDYYVNWHKNADEPYPSAGKVLMTAHTQTDSPQNLLGGTGVARSIFANERVFTPQTGTTLPLHPSSGILIIARELSVFNNSWSS